jgi:hypothetical protein
LKFPTVFPPPLAIAGAEYPLCPPNEEETILSCLEKDESVADPRTSNAHVNTNPNPKCFELSKVKDEDARTVLRSSWLSSASSLLLLLLLLSRALVVVVANKGAFSVFMMIFSLALSLEGTSAASLLYILREKFPFLFSSSFLFMCDNITKNTRFKE